MGNPGSGAAAVPAEVLRSWDQAEARLFPLIMARPDLYQQAVALIGELAARLRATCQDFPALLAAQRQGGALVTAAGAGVTGVAPELIAAAACATRYRELVSEGAAAGRL
ncbi:MAG: hypothetical protein LBI49_00720, partial [Nocardiopsaceae bacterium]|nr:hypothetical protein [Nocardiopsaceae bacterium]